MCLSTAQADKYRPSTNIYGALGLNTIPNARMDPAGTIRLGVSTLDPYAHAFLGFQLADPLSITLRQTAETSNLGDDPDRLYPGIDLKFRAFKESRYVPEMSVGLQSALGHKRMAGEYLALSKRYNNFDFTAGIGWGRYGTAGHFSNPLKAVSDHFGGNRNLGTGTQSELPNEARHWFTGDNVGLFGGFEYFTPLDGLSLKFDYGADRYSAEKTSFDYNPGAPWSVGLSYSPMPWMDSAVALQGTDKIMARVSFKGTPGQWLFTTAHKTPPPAFRPFRTTSATPQAGEVAAQQDGLLLYGTRTSNDRKTLYSALHLDPDRPTPLQIGRAVRYLANEAGPEIEKITIATTARNLKGPKISVMRSDFESALTEHHGSATEIWQNTEITDGYNAKAPKPPHPSFAVNQFKPLNVKLTLENQISLAEEDHGALYRSSLVLAARRSEFFGLLDYGAGTRLNIIDNLDKLERTRTPALDPIRSNVANFADNRFALDHLYTGFTHSFGSDKHLALTAGYLEEMIGGLGGEVLYRPYGKRFAIGAEGWIARPRDPDTALNMGYSNVPARFTGHVQGWYEFPEDDITLNARFGRYLAQDTGVEIGAAKSFKNGARLSGYTVLSNTSEADQFGGTTHLQHGIKLSLPLGSIKHLPDGTEAHFKAEPFARDIAQSVRKPVDLYALTTPFSASHIGRHWDGVLE